MKFTLVVDRDEICAKIGKMLSVSLDGFLGSGSPSSAIVLCCYVYRWIGYW